MAFSTPRIVSNRASPFHKPLSARARSPTRDEQTLSLRQVTGTTVYSQTCFSSIADDSIFAFTAGCGAVVVSLHGDSKPRQQFFHARPTASPLITTPSIYDSPTPAGQQGARSRTAASLRESGYGTPQQVSPFHDYSDYTSGRGGNTRTKAASCVALSPDGRHLAIGENGHKPRVLIFSTRKDSPRDIPQYALAEHTFGVRCLAFSADSQYLASLGDINDGFLYIWSISSKTGTAQLKASNKCTSNVRQTVWMGTSLITIGTRHVKIWRLDQPVHSPNKRFSEAGPSFASPSSRALFGRNCLLGPLLDKVFTAVVPISHVQAIVCSDTGDICLLDDSEPIPVFTKIAEVYFAITAVTCQSRRFVLIAGQNGQMKSLDIATKTGLLLPDSTLPVLSTAMVPETDIALPVVALGILKQGLVTVDSSKGLNIFDMAQQSANDISFRLRHSYPAHPAGVLGIRPLAQSSSTSGFMTWSADGTVLFWTSVGLFSRSYKVPLDQLSEHSDEYRNELKVANAFSNGRFLLSGDRLGVLRVIELDTNRVVYELKAHGNEITDIAVSEYDDDTLIASASRDRTVQIFRWHSSQSCEHLQTIEEHSGSVSSVLFSSDGSGLISASSDRTLMIMDAVPSRADGRGKAVGFLVRRAITLKAAPLSIQLSTIATDCLLVSTTDRQILKYDLKDSAVSSSFKTSDQEGGDSVMLASIVEVPVSRKSSLIAGVSTSDKSIRLYDTAGRLVGKEHGHTEGMMGVCLLTASADGLIESSIVTVASDGTIFLWDLLQSGQQLQNAFSSLALTDSPGQSPSLLASRPPLRKVLSSSELTRLHELREEHETPEVDSSPSTTKPLLRRKASKLSIMRTPRLDPTPALNTKRSPTQPPPAISTRINHNRSISTAVGPSSPSPPTQKAQSMRVSSRSTPIAPQARRRSMSAAPSPTAPNTLTMSTDSLCRALHTYRKKLSSSSDILALDSVRQLERELTSTAKVLAEKSARNETVMAKLLDQYSEKLVGLLDEKIEKSIERKMRRAGSTDVDECYDGDEGGISG